MIHDKIWIPVFYFKSDLLGEYRQTQDLVSFDLVKESKIRESNK